MRFDQHTQLVIARKERSEGRGNPSYLEEGGRICLFAYWPPVDRHGLRPRDDKAERNGSVRFGYNTILSLRGGSVASDAAIHRVSIDAFDLYLRLLVHSGSPRAFSPRDDKVVK